MSSSVAIEFVPLDGLRPQAGPEAAPSVLVAFAADYLALSPKTREIVGSSVGRFERAAAVANFKGKNGSAVDILAPEGLGFDRLLVLGTGKGAKVDALEDTLPDHVGLGGALMAGSAAASARPCCSTCRSLRAIRPLRLPNWRLASNSAPIASTFTGPRKKTRASARAR